LALQKNLETRKLVERAKGKRLNLDERTAHRPAVGKSKAPD